MNDGEDMDDNPKERNNEPPGADEWEGDKSNVEGDNVGE